jgi:site-specific DNA-methyltransferase (adenine-specific)
MKTNNANQFIKEEILNKATIFNGNNMDSLKCLPDNSVDSIVTDPPYGLSFLGKKWDHDVPSVEFWKEVYRVLKPGGYVLSFGGTRTYHRMVVNIEDAGFEIRDQIMWIYGQGFPKSHDLGKAVDKIQGNNRIDLGVSPNSRKSVKKNDTIYLDKKNIRLTKGCSEFEGWGTALKPANEPICVARKPLSEKTVALNALKHGTGGLNIESSKIGNEYSDKRFPSNVIIDEVAGEEIGDPRKFFYCPKVSKNERNFGDDENRNIHPTVKPVDLMRYLIKLVTPKNGVILDPFMGSGSTGVGALIEGFQFIGMEMDNGYFEIAKQRIQHFEKFKEMLDQKEKAKTPSKQKKQSKKKVETTVQPNETIPKGIWANRGLRRVA